MKKKGFTLIELIVVMTIISILVLLGVPKYKTYTEEARLTKLIVETKELEQASQQYYIKNNDWPRLSNDAYSKEEVLSFGEKILDKTGKVVVLEETGNYYDIDYAKLNNYISKIDNAENYILQNPVGSVYSIDKLTEVAKLRLDRTSPEEVQNIILNKENEYISLSWTGVLDSGLDKYNIYRDGALIGNSKTVNYNDTSVDINITHVYKVTSVDAADNESTGVEVTYTPPIKPFLRTYNLGSSDNFHSVQQTSDGGYIAVGSTYMNSDVKAVIAKFDKDANIQWMKSFDVVLYDYFYSIQQTSDGGYIAAGNTLTRFGVYSTKTPSVQDAVIAKFDESGNNLWTKRYSKGNWSDLKSIKQTLDGGYIAVGRAGNTPCYDYIAKFDENGNIVWEKSNSGTYGFEDVIITNDNEYIAICDYNSIDFTILNFDENGNKKWVKNYGGSGTDNLLTIKRASDGGYIAVGNSNSTTGDLSGLNKGGIDAVIIKLDKNWNKEWIKTYGGSNEDKFESVQQTKDGGFVAVGWTKSSNEDIINYKGNEDFIVVKFNSNGENEWKQTYGGIKADLFKDIQLTSDGECIITGYTTSSDGDLAGKTPYGEDFVLMKIDSEGNFN